MNTASSAQLEAIVFLDHFADLPDPRQLAKVIYPLNEVLLVSLLGVLAGAETFTDIARFGEKKLDLLRRFLPFANGAPAHDRLGEIFAALDSGQFQRCFVAWVSALTGLNAEVIAIDGKTSRRSGSKVAGVDPIHMVSAFAAGRRLVLGQVKVEAKSNEIIAIPHLLDLLVLEGATITIDAIGCQRDIARKIIDKKGEYVLALKGNQGTLQEDVELFAAEQKARDFKDTKVSHSKDVNGDHGRIETRKTTVFHDIDWLCQRHQWPGLQAVIMVESEREIAGKTQRETRFYLTSSTAQADKLADCVRSHWAIENSLHWVLDMVFRDDERRIRSGNAATNFVTLCHIAQNLLRQSKGKDSMRLKRKTAAWDDEFLLALITP